VHGRAASAASAASGLLARDRHGEDAAQTTGDGGLAEHRAPAQISGLNTFHIEVRLSVSVIAFDCTPWWCYAISRSASAPRGFQIMRTRSALLLTTILCCSAWGQTYTISTLAGTGMPVNVAGTSVSLAYGSGLSKPPQYVAADAAGNVFLPYGETVLRLDATTGMLTLAAGNGTQGFSGDNGPATSAQLNTPTSLAVDSRKVSGGFITTVAGNGTRCHGLQRRQRPGHQRPVGHHPQLYRRRRGLRRQPLHRRR
jgi:hypothetical protein